MTLTDYADFIGLWFLMYPFPVLALIAAAWVLWSIARVIRRWHRRRTLRAMRDYVRQLRSYDYD